MKLSYFSRSELFFSYWWDSNGGFLVLEATELRYNPSTHLLMFVVCSYMHEKLCMAKNKSTKAHQHKKYYDLFSDQTWMLKFEWDSDKYLDSL